MVVALSLVEKLSVADLLLYFWVEIGLGDWLNRFMRIFLYDFIFDVLREPSEILSFNLVLPHGILTKYTFTPIFDRYPWLGYLNKLA